MHLEGLPKAEVEGQSTVMKNKSEHPWRLEKHISHKHSLKIAAIRLIQKLHW
uniref:Uncharacterized protein n=1 Tax=Anguilla anguilla TaxID=7936 RepID=A0A0E9Q3J0_ANGAN